MISTGDDESHPAFTPDGQKFFFISTRPVAGQPKQETDLWIMDKTATGWSEPRHLGSTVNSATSEWFPTVTSSGTLYFGSGQQGGKGGVDIWRAKLINGQYGEPENLGEAINTAASETEPLIAPDESYLIFAAAGRPEGLGAYDLMSATTGMAFGPRPLTSARRLTLPPGTSRRRSHQTGSISSSPAIAASPTSPGSDE